MSNFRHKAIYGVTGCGKTWLMKRLAQKLRGHKQKVIVYSAVGDIDWASGCKFFHEVDALEKALADPANFGAHVFLDEASVLYSEVTRKKHPMLTRLFTMGRHKGYTCYIATQYPTSIPRHVRVNCAECFCFRLGDYESALLVHRDYGSLSYNGVPSYQLIQNLPKLRAVHMISPDTIEFIEL